MNRVSCGVIVATIGVLTVVACDEATDPAVIHDGGADAASDGGIGTDAATATDGSSGTDALVEVDSAVPVDAADAATDATSDASASDASDASANDASANDASADASDGAVACTKDSTSRPNGKSLVLGNASDGTMALEAAGCGTSASVAYVSGGRGQVPAPSLTDFFVKIDPTDTTKWYPGVTQVFNFPFGGTGDDEEGYVAPKAASGAITIGDLFPGFDVAKAHAMLKIVSTAATPCNTIDGFVVTVPGHAEAVIHYLDFTGSALTVGSATATTTSAAGAIAFVSIEGVTPGTPVQIAGTKTGCEINAKLRGQIDTGKVPLVAGRVAAISYTVTKL